MSTNRIPLTQSEALRLADYDRAHHGGELADMLARIGIGDDTSAVWRPAHPGEDAPPLDTTVTLNPDYASMVDVRANAAYTTYTAKANGGVPGTIVHRNIPGGFWAVKLREQGGAWTVFCDRDEAVYVTGAGVSGCIVRVADVVVIGRVDWSEETCERSRRSHQVLIGREVF